MKLPDIFSDRKKTLAAGLLAFIVIGTVGGGLYFSRKKQTELDINETQSENTKTSEDDSDSNFTSGDNYGLTDESTSENPIATKENKASQLADINIKGVLQNDENNAIQTFFTGSRGMYTIEKKVDEKWVPVLTRVEFSGQGELSLNDQIPVSETERMYRIYRIEDNNKIGPKEILVDRNLVVSGGGVTNFPGAL